MLVDLRPDTHTARLVQLAFKVTPELADEFRAYACTTKRKGPAMLRDMLAALKGKEGGKD